jgi:hypothetical protein
LKLVKTIWQISASQSRKVHQSFREHQQACVLSGIINFSVSCSLNWSAFCTASWEINNSSATVPHSDHSMLLHTAYTEAHQNTPKFQWLRDHSRNTDLPRINKTATRTRPMKRISCAPFRQLRDPSCDQSLLHLRLLRQPQVPFTSSHMSVSTAHTQHGSYDKESEKADSIHPTDTGQWRVIVFRGRFMQVPQILDHSFPSSGGTSSPSTDSQYATVLPDHRNHATHYPDSSCPTTPSNNVATGGKMHVLGDGSARLANVN